MAEGSNTIVRRNLPGTKTSNFSKWPEESFDEMDSTLAVQQYIQQTIRKDPQGELTMMIVNYCFDGLITKFHDGWFKLCERSIV